MTIDFVRKKDTKDPLVIDPRKFACHTAVLAQSGSGKSFMVGRLIEEFLLKTKARVVILDPNSDFVRLIEPEPTVWTNTALKPWFFPGDTKTAFRKGWKGVGFTLLSNRNLANARPPRIGWGGLSVSEQASIMNIDPRLDAEFYWFLTLSDAIASERWDDGNEPTYDFTSFRDAVSEICDYVITGIGEAEDITQNPLAQSLRALGSGVALQFKALVYTTEELEIWRSFGDGEPDIAEHVSGHPHQAHAIVVDLLSLGSDAERMAVVNRVLSSIWTDVRAAHSDALRDIDQPDRRVPTIIVIDEAHNVVPAVRSSAAGERIASEVIRIAAEGRKFGLALLAVTQRPRKLDGNVLSECDNLLLMKMTNTEDVNYAKQSFGFVSDWAAAEASALSIGDILLQGRVGSGDTRFHVAPRRTREGGRGLDDNYWSSPW